MTNPPENHATYTRPARRRFALGLAVAAALGGLAPVACSGEKAPLAYGEPIRVRGGAFKEGPLPGDPPGSPTRPEITAYESASTVVRLGQSGKIVLGRATPEAVAIGIAFADLGTGHWIFPAGAADPLTMGELGWQAECDFGVDLPPGPHPLRVVAIDANGHAGAQRDLSVCVTPEISDNLAACDRARTPPAVAISLAWDVGADLDLVVVDPNGRVVDPKHPRTVGDAGADAGSLSIGAVDRDSNAGCRVDALARETLVFQKAPPPGSYFVYANLFDACGKGPVHFRASLTEAQLAPDGVTQVQVETLSKTGTALPQEANGGSRLGTFVFEIPF